MREFALRIPADDRLRGQVLVDGHDIADAVIGATIHATQAQTTVVLDLAPIRRPMDVELAAAAVIVDQAVHDALVTLGWTPPQLPGPLREPTPQGTGPKDVTP